jgi:hypothetical protein
MEINILSVSDGALTGWSLANNSMSIIGTLTHLLISNGFRVFSLSLATSIPANLKILLTDHCNVGEWIISRQTQRTQECFGFHSPHAPTGFHYRAFQEFEA